MCLTTYLEKFPVKLDKEGVGVGWKVFHKNKDGSLSPEMYGTCIMRYKLDYWTTAICPIFYENVYLTKNCRRKTIYIPHFHIFTTRADARKWCGRYGQNDLTITGLQILHFGFLKCIVAKEILITNVRG